ncbi:ATP-binding protein [Streptomyces durbertensis]|uniref:ATP-binding protein n=1 Tax=Streptomyces durbertensis TaxID=2448886 RepID=UPI001E4A9DF3|nr:ATP-binding protein [Streptomyces durbertensis]
MAGRMAERDGGAPGAPTLDCGAGLGPDDLTTVADPSLDEVQLPNRPESAKVARQLAETVLLNRWRLPGQLVEHTVLLVSELVGNAVLHTGAQRFGLRMYRTRGRVRVEVRDPSRGLPCLLPVQPMDTSGRGLWLVERLSDRWGVDLQPRGKTTWFEMRVVEQ